MKLSAKQIKQEFENKGCYVDMFNNGQSYRAGGTIVIFEPGLDQLPDLCYVKKLDLVGFAGTGYDGRGRLYKVFYITADTKYRQVDEHTYFATPEQYRKCNIANLYYFIDAEYKTSPLENIFKELKL